MKLLNAAIMPNPGQYKLEEISPEEFSKILNKADRIDSYISFSSTKKVIEKISGVNVELNRKKCYFNSQPEEYLLLVLKPNVRGHRNLTENDFIFYKCEYQPLK